MAKKFLKVPKLANKKYKGLKKLKVSLDKGAPARLKSLAANLKNLAKLKKLT